MNFEHELENAGIRALLIVPKAAAGGVSGC
jgi:hypothetical protein